MEDRDAVSREMSTSEAEIGTFEQLLDDPHLSDRGFWKEVAHPELGRSATYPGEAAIYSGSPWRIPSQIRCRLTVRSVCGTVRTYM